MNRETEYRGKTIDGNRWVYGDIRHYKNGRVKIYDERIEFGTGAVNGFGFEVIPFTIGQYIGWKDRNNKKGYKDDLYTDRLGWMWRIGWNDFYGQWMLFDTEDDSDWHEINAEEFGYGEITRSIHDTEEQAK